MPVKLTKALQQAYIDLFRIVELNPENFTTVDRAVTDMRNKKVI